MTGTDESYTYTFSGLLNENRRVRRHRVWACIYNNIEVGIIHIMVCNN